MRQYYLKNRERLLRYQQNKRAPRVVRALNLKRRYGISLEEYERMLKKQKYRCAACGTKEHGGRDWHVDHCHETSKVRGILCQRCNLTLGHAAESIERLAKLAAYVGKHNQ